MRKKLSAIGSSLGIVIEKPILELLDIDRETAELDMRTDGERLIMEPIWGAKRAEDVLLIHEEQLAAAPVSAMRTCWRPNVLR